MTDASFPIRAGEAADLEGLNAVIARAVMGWDLPERVKRLSMPLYRYDVLDLEHLDMVVAEHDGRIIGVATWEEAHSRDVPAGRPALSLHGLYVDPEWQRHGVGRALLAAVRAAAADRGVAGILVKAQVDARGFFAAAGLEPVPVADGERDYAHRFWMPVAPPAES